MFMSEMKFNLKREGENYIDENHEEWIWVEEYRRHAKKYKYDTDWNLWCKLNQENGTYEPIVELPKPKPTAAMGKYGSLRLNFIWQTPCLMESIMMNGDVTKHCEEMNERVTDLIQDIVEKKKASAEYQKITEEEQYLPMLQALERYTAEAEEEILSVTVYAI